MEAAQKTFISSTFWTERIGPSAALKTLDVMERERSWETITETGNMIGNSWLKLASENNLKISLNGMPALIGFSFDSDQHLKYKTFITQEMLKRGYLAATSIYVSVVHTKEILDTYFDNLVEIFKIIQSCENGQNSIDSLLNGPVCHGGFKRLN
jgi:glutamate-1-semialdehyde aminotransferase